MSDDLKDPSRSTMLLLDALYTAVLFSFIYYFVLINNNYKTSTAPIFSKIIELRGTPSTGVGQTHSLGTMQSSSTMIRWQGNVLRISECEKVSFQMVTERNYII